MSAGAINRLYIGCGPSPIHPQHLEILGDPNDWTFIDLYVKEPHIKNWDGKTLDEVPDESVDEIYSSHTLEHFEHAQVPGILRTWHRKLVKGGKLTVNVPNLMWAFRLLQRLEAGSPVDGYYNTYLGEHGVFSILYGSQSHEGEYHKGAFTPSHLYRVLLAAGFEDIETELAADGHDMGVLIAVCRK